MRKPSIVDEDAYSAMGLLLDDLLTGAGYVARLWPDSSGAFEFIRQEHPDLVILDLSLERHGDGLVALNQLCCHKATSNIPVIVLADDSLVLPMMRVLPVASGFEVLAKPFYLDQLMGKVWLIVEPPRATFDGWRANALATRYAPGEAVAIDG